MCKLRNGPPKLQAKTPAEAGVITALVLCGASKSPERSDYSCQSFVIDIQMHDQANSGVARRQLYAVRIHVVRQCGQAIFRYRDEYYAGESAVHLDAGDIGQGVRQFASATMIVSSSMRR